MTDTPRLIEHAFPLKKTSLDSRVAHTSPLFGMYAISERPAGPGPVTGMAKAAGS